MEYTMTLPSTFESCDVRTLLEKRWRIPRKVRHFLRIRKNVLINGEKAHFQQTVQALDKVTLLFEASDYPENNILLGQADLVDVLFEDEHLLVVNKPINMKTHPNQPQETDTLLNHVAAYLAPADLKPSVVHRLDKETSGAIIFAKNPFILPLLGKILEDQAISRDYHALAAGKISPQKGIIEKNIARDRYDRRKRVVVKPTQGQTAITHYEVKKYLKNQTYLTCTLETGRTHQIRVHLASLGHPIEGDPLYNPHENKEKRLMLHATSLRFYHPLTDQLISIHSEPNLI